MPIIVGILTFISRMVTTSQSLKTRSVFIFQHLFFINSLNFVETDYLVSFGKYVFEKKDRNELLQSASCESLFCGMFLKKVNNGYRGRLAKQIQCIKK